MRVILQRVSSTQIHVMEEQIASSSKSGILAFIGFGKEDEISKLPLALEKIVNLRIFPNELGRFDLSLKDIKGDLTLVPQFTLYAETQKGRRPEFFSALEPIKAKEYFNKLVELAKLTYEPHRVYSGQFGADMKISLINEGPVTIPFEL